MDKKILRNKRHTCFCNRRFKNNEDPIFKKVKALKKIKEKQTHRKYPKPDKILDFNFKPGSKVAVMDKEKKPPKSGKLKMKTYGKMDTWTNL
tara:strand:+ start:13081 stop:13356 length:276 start_codon:yes stop_codon:yes gene_type:complete